MIVMKFGGASIGDAKSIHRVTQIVLDRLNHQPVIVVSAIAKTTRNLLAVASLAANAKADQSKEHLKNVQDFHLEMIHDLIPEKNDSDILNQIDIYFAELDKLIDGISVLRELTPRTQDKFLSYGELVSSRIITAVFLEHGIDAVWLDTRQCVITDDQFTQCNVLQEITYNKIQEKTKHLINSNKIPVLQGFIGSTEEGTTTTLGFEGSDLTATLVGAALGSKTIQIWKDVPGIMTADPAICKTAHTLKSISHKEAFELTFFGAKVLHPRAMTPALEKEIPVKICNAKQPKEPGTMISPSPEPCTNLIKSITYKNQMILLHLRPKDQIKPSQFIQNVLDLFDREGIIPYILNTAVEKISMVVDSTIRGEHVIKQIQKDMIVKVKTGKATISLIGDKLQNHPTIATEICTLLNPTPIDLFSHGTSPINFTMVVNEKEVARIITSLHDYFFKQLDSKRFT